MAEILVRTVRNGEGPGATGHAAAGKLLFSDAYIEVLASGGLPDLDVRSDARGLTLLLGRAAGGRSAASLGQDYQRGGAATIAPLDGNFLALFYDQSDSTVSVIHDKAGLRHAFYWCQGEDFALSSELSWLMEASTGDHSPRRGLNRSGLALYMTFQYFPAPHTIIEGVLQLPPGTELLSSRGQIPQIQQFGEFPARDGTEQPDGTGTPSEVIGELLNQSITEQLDPSLQTGAMLSGGMDTSTNVALLAEFHDIRAATFTAAFEERRYDEKLYAQLVAEHYGLEHVVVTMEPRMIEALPEIVKAFDSPNADQAILPQYFVCRAVRQYGCGQLVTGEGGDEVLGYPQTHDEEILGHPDRDLDLRGLPKDPAALARLYLEKTFLAPRELRSELLTRLGVDPDSPYEHLEDVYRRYPERPPFERLYFGQWRTWLRDGVYMKDSRLLRHLDLAPVLPFIDTRLMQYLADLPLEAKLAGLDDKQFLRTLLEGHLPQAIFERDKHKFYLPFPQWSRNEVKGFLRDNLLTADGFVVEQFGRDLVQRLLADNEIGVANHSRVLWAFLFLEFWYQEWAHRWL